MPTTRPAASTTAADAVEKSTSGAQTRPEALDTTWVQRERAAKSDAWDDGEDDTPYGDPSKVKDQGILESIGKAVSTPVIEADTEKDPLKRTPR